MSVKKTEINLFIFSLVSLTCLSSIVVAKSNTCNTQCSKSKNTWLPRSFGSYLMHDLAHDQSVTASNDQKLTFAFFNEYMQNFSGKCSKNCKNLGSMPFWSGDNTLTIGNNDGRAQLDGYQLGLGNVEVDSNGIAGVISLNPRVQHFGTDMMMQYQQSKDQKGFYCKVHAPLGAMIMQPRLKESPKVKPDGEISFLQTTTGAPAPINYQFPAYPVPGRRHTSMSEAFIGSLIEGDSFRGNGDKPVLLRKGRIAKQKQTTIRLGDISASLGYNVIVKERGGLGVAFKATCPTGNVPTADYMLEPIFGRAGAWAVGGEISGLYRAWENEENGRYLDVRAQAEILHLFPGRTPNYRTFDLKKNGLGSKYMLVQQYFEDYSFGNPTVQRFVPSTAIQPASNITTLPVISKIPVEGALALLLDFCSGNWNASVGAEFWGRSRECLSIDMLSVADLRAVSLNKYAVLGRQLSIYNVDGGTPTQLSTYLCEPAAKINQSQDAALLAGPLGGLTNPISLPSGVADARVSANRIPEDVTEALDIDGAAASSAMTGKVTGQVGYTWSERQHEPSLVLTGGAEFTGNTNNAIQFWSVGLQGSVSF